MTDQNNSLPPRARAELAEIDNLSVVARSVMPMPSRPAIRKVEPQPDYDELGKMSAEAVLTQYEAAAKAVEMMGESVKERVTKIAAALLECDRDMKEIAETAAMIREKGNHVSVQIEEAAALSNNIRKACLDFRKQVGL